MGECGTRGVRGPRELAIDRRHREYRPGNSLNEGRLSTRGSRSCCTSARSGLSVRPQPKSEPGRVGLRPTTGRIERRPQKAVHRTPPAPSPSQGDAPRCTRGNFEGQSFWQNLPQRSGRSNPTQELHLPLPANRDCRSRHAQTASRGPGAAPSSACSQHPHVWSTVPNP